MNAPTLFDHDVTLPEQGVTHRHPTATEKDAAKRTKPRRSYNLILQHLAEEGDATACTIWQATGCTLQWNHTYTRLSELAKNELVVMLDETGPTVGPNGLPGSGETPRWRITDAGRVYVARLEKTDD